MVVFGSMLEKKAYALIEPGEYVLTLSELEESEGQFGDRIIWKWLVAPMADYTAYFTRDDGQEKTLWAFTDPDIVLGSLAHQFAEALCGRMLGKDSAPPTEDELVGKRLVAYITHETPKTGKSAGVKREKITDGSIKRFRIPGPKPAQVTADASDEDIDRALLVTKLRKQVARLQKLDKTAGQKAQEAMEASDLDTAPLAQVEQLSEAVGEAITIALDA